MGKSAASSSGVQRVIRALLAALTVLCGAAFARDSRAETPPFDLASSDWEGCGELVRLARAELGPTRVVPTTQIDFEDLRPEDGLILLYPEKSLDADELSKFMRAGGRVVLLDDYGRGESLLRHFSMVRTAAPRHPAEMLRNNPELPIAEPASAHPVVQDVTKVVTNHPTGLELHDLSPVLKIRSTDEPDVYVAIAGLVGKGRLLAVGDPSIVMNSMLKYSGNKTFARGLVHYAVDHDNWGKRGGRLFIAAGDFEQKGTYGEEGSTLDDFLRDLKEALEVIRNEGVPPPIANALAWAVGLALVVWIAARAGRLHKPIVPRFVRGTPEVAQGGVAGHAAVIAAPKTSRILAILELKSALEEQLTSMLGLPQVPSHQELLAKIEEARLLDAEGLHTLRRLLLRMSAVETMIVYQRTGGTAQAVRDTEVVSMARSVKSLLDAAAERSAASRLSSMTSPGEPPRSPDGGSEQGSESAS